MTGDIVWINGPYEAGIWNDISIFRNSCLSHLAPNERVEADDGYIGEHPRYIKCPAGFTNPKENEAMQQRVRNRQEFINEKFKNCTCLVEPWHHEIDRHGDAFRVIAIISQLSINNGEKLFACDYLDPPVEDADTDEDL